MPGARGGRAGSGQGPPGSRGECELSPRCPAHGTLSLPACWCRQRCGRPLPRAPVSHPAWGTTQHPVPVTTARNAVHAQHKPIFASHGGSPGVWRPWVPGDPQPLEQPWSSGSCWEARHAHGSLSGTRARPGRDRPRTRGVPGQRRLLAQLQRHVTRGSRTRAVPAPWGPLPCVLAPPRDMGGEVAPSGLSPVGAVPCGSRAGVAMPARPPGVRRVSVRHLPEPARGCHVSGPRAPLCSGAQPGP